MPELQICKLFKTAEELEMEEAHINGNVPNYVRGKFIRVGPGHFLDADPKFAMRHFLDGYSILSSFEIDGDRVKFQKKFLQSDSFKKAMAMKRPVLCEFGTPKMVPDPTKGTLSRIISNLIPYELTDNDQLNVFQIGTDLFVSSETCNFREISPTNLRTGIKHDTWNLFGLNICSAHPITDNTGITYNIGVTVLSGLKYHIVAIPPPTTGKESGKELMKRAKILCTIPSSFGCGMMSYVHSFGMTKKYLVFIEQPYCILVSKAIKSIMKCYSFKDWLEWKPDLGNRFYLIEKSSGKILKTEYINAGDSFFFLHFINCYEESNQIVVDITAYPNPSAIDNMYLDKLRAGIFDEGDQPSAQRFVLPILNDLTEIPEDINLVEIKSNAVAKRDRNRILLKPEVMTESGFEFAQINPGLQGKKYNYFYATGSAAPGPFEHKLAKIDVLKKEHILWPISKKKQYYCPGEPQFIRDPNGKSEDDGVLLSAVSDIKPGANDFLIFLDAKSMKELGRAQFKAHSGCPMNKSAYIKLTTAIKLIK